jgi:Flp pilus assembly secretin CpaC
MPCVRVSVDGFGRITARAEQAAPFRAIIRASHKFVLSCALACTLSCALLLSDLSMTRSVAAEREDTVVQINRSTLLKLPPGNARIIVGDPTLVRVAVVSGALAVLTGTAFGETNLTVLDKGGAVIMERSLLVTDSTSSGIASQRGTERSTQINCEDRCQRSQAMGDVDDAFSTATAQQEAVEAAVRSNKSQGAAAAASAPSPQPPTPEPPASNPGSRKRDQL